MTDRKVESADKGRLQRRRQRRHKLESLQAAQSPGERADNVWNRPMQPQRLSAAQTRLVASL